MGVVRRDGDWRLEKKREGVYEITFQREPQLKVHTPDASTRMEQQPMFDNVPVREVSTYSEVEGLFEEKAHGPPPVGMNYGGYRTGSGGFLTEDDLREDADLSDLPPGGIGVGLLLAGTLILYSFWESGNTLLLLFGVGFVGGGLAILAYGGYLLKTDGWREAWDFLATPTDEKGSKSTDNSEKKKTPPTPEKLKNKLFFERANRCCEYCGDEFDQPDVHHIEPRSEGGPNKPSNLIVLCPNCHRKADNGIISRSKLRYRIKEQSELPAE